MERTNKHIFKKKFFYSELTKDEILEKEFTCNFRYYIEVNYKSYSKIYRFYDLNHLFDYTYKTEETLNNSKGPTKEKILLKFNTLVKGIKKFTN